MKAISLLFLLVALSLQVSVTSAQTTDVGDMPPTILAEAGFGGVLPADCWAPLRVIVSARDGAFEGIVRVRFVGAGGMDLSSMMPIATTPGKETLLPMTVWVPARFDAMRVELLDTRGRRVASSRYDRSGSSMSIYLEAPASSPIVLAAGSPSLVQVYGRSAYERRVHDADELERLDRIALARISTVSPLAPGQPPWLPNHPAAYEGVSALVLHGALVHGMGSDALNALHAWLFAGGRLLLIDADNNVLRMVFADSMPNGLAFAPPRTMRLRGILADAGEVRARELRKASSDNGWEPLDAVPDAAAHGPIGLGWAMVLGVSPEEFKSEGQSGTLEALWQVTLGELIREDLEAARSRLAIRRSQTYLPRSMANTSAFLWVSRSPTVGVGAFVAIFAMMLTLGILLGPIDRFVLRRMNLPHRWWLVALVWIGFASLGAWLLPAQVRSGPTTVSSIRAIDALDTGDGHVHAWQASYTGVFMNRSGVIGFEDSDSDAWISPWQNQSEFYGPTTQGVAMGWNASGTTMRPMPAASRLWTLRHFHEQGPTAAPFEAEFEREGDRFVLRIRGQEASRIEHLSVRTAGQWLSMLPGGSREHDADGFAIVASAMDLSDSPTTAFATSERDLSTLEFRTKPTPALLSFLPGSNRRTQALDALGAREDWAVVYASWSDGHRSIGSNIGEEFRTLWSCRLAVPVRKLGTGLPAGDRR